jgi:RNA polymerase sigma-70 factor (ECF subfamily)
VKSALDDDVTGWLKAWCAGDPEALDRLWPLVHDELRGAAARCLRRERTDHTLQPTALVHETYLRLIDQERVSWADRNHFYAVAARIMRRILVDHARHRARRKRGGGLEPLTIDLAADIAIPDRTDLLAVEEALTSLETRDPDTASIVELRFFAGLTAVETANVLGCSERTVMRRWSFARRWLHQELKQRGAAHG